MENKNQINTSSYLDAVRDWGSKFVVVAPDANVEEVNLGQEAILAGWAAKWGNRATHQEILGNLVERKFWE
jgi:hypothetical protein